MEVHEIEKIEQFLQKEMLQLNIKSKTIKIASQRFDIPIEDIEVQYDNAKSKIRKEARNRAWMYLISGSLFFGVGLFGTLSKTGFIFYGAILFGLGALFTSFGLFRLSMSK